MMSRKRVLLCLLFICGAICLLLLYDRHSPAGLCFSRESGFYEDSFELKLSAPFGARIYYTLDGSLPDEDAFLYTTPILIDDATSQPNLHSMRTDTSPWFFYEKPVYKLPDYPVDKCTVVRAAYQDADGNFSEVKTESYFVGYGEKKGYKDINVISIVTDPGNLFDYDTGIYVLGRKYDEYLDRMENAERVENLPEEDANSYQHGREWERPVDIQIFNTEREVLLKQSCGVRIQGGGSRTNLPKSLNLYARENYSRAARFYVDLFGTGYMPDTVTLTAGGQDTIAKFRDMFVSTLTKDRAFSTMNYEPYTMFLNGEHWGVYWLTERYNDTYLGYYYDADADNIIMMKNNKLTRESDEDWGLYVSMTNFLQDTDFTKAENYESVSYVIDLQSYIDYYATEIYIGSYADWPGTNEAFWRVRKPAENTGAGVQYEDGRWRWMLFDVNTSALRENVVEKDVLAHTMERSPVFHNLCQSDAFKKQFTITLMDLANETFSERNTEPVIEKWLALMKEPTETHLRRFYGEESLHRFDEEVADIRAFLEHRKPYAVKYLKENFGLEGVSAPVEIETTNVLAGRIVLNTITPTFDGQGEWKGEYFTDYPVTLSVAVNEGYRFVGWEISKGQEKETSMETSLELEVPENGLRLRAVFEKI